MVLELILIVDCNITHINWRCSATTYLSTLWSCNSKVTRIDHCVGEHFVSDVCGKTKWHLQLDSCMLHSSYGWNTIGPQFIRIEHRCFTIHVDHHWFTNAVDRTPAAKHEVYYTILFLFTSRATETTKSRKQKIKWRYAVPFLVTSKSSKGQQRKEHFPL